MRVPTDKRFEFERLLGEGPTARVWLARDRERGGTPVAIKAFHAFPARLETELPKQARAVHPAIAGMLCRIPDAALAKPRIAREYVDGIPPADVVRARGPQALIAVAAESLRALDALNAIGRSHGAVTPGNLLVRTQPRAGYRVALLDGGVLSALTHSARRLPYLAPERLAHGPASTAADVYSLGVLLFEALHGRTPFRVRDGGPDAWLSATTTGRRIRPNVPDGLPPDLTTWFDELLLPVPDIRPSPREALARLRAIVGGPEGAALERERAAGTVARLLTSIDRTRPDALRALWEQLSGSREPRIIWFCGAPGERDRILRHIAGEADDRGWKVTFPAEPVETLPQTIETLGEGQSGSRPSLLILPDAFAAGDDLGPALERFVCHNGDPAPRILAGANPDAATAPEVDRRLQRLLVRAGRGPSLRRVDLAPLTSGAVTTVVQCAGGSIDPASLADRTAGDPDRIAMALVADSSPDDLDAAAADATERLQRDLSTDAVRWLCGHPGVDDLPAVAELESAGLITRIDGRPQRATGPLVDALAAACGRSTTSAAVAVAPPLRTRPSALDVGWAALDQAQPDEIGTNGHATDATTDDEIHRRIVQGVALTVAGRYGDAVATARRAAEFAARLGDVDAVADARVVQALALARCGRAADARMLLESIAGHGAAAEQAVRLARVEVDRLSPHADPGHLCAAIDLVGDCADIARATWRQTVDLECRALAGDSTFADLLDGSGARHRSLQPSHWALRAEIANVVWLARRGESQAAADAAQAAFDRAQDTNPVLAAEAAALGVTALRAIPRLDAARRLAALGRRSLDVAVDRVGDVALRAGFLEHGAFTALREGASAAQRRLEALYEMSGALNSENNPDVLLEAILDMALDVVSAERGMILLRDEHGELNVRLARNLERQTVVDAEKFSRSVVRQAGTGRPVLAVDTGSDERMRDFKSVSVFGIRSVLCVPLRSRGDIIGVVYLDSRTEGAPFSADDLEFLEAFADHAALALENARQRRRLEQENERLQVAAEARAHFGNIIGESAPMREVFDLIEKFAASELPVLVQGESGTGKELVAHAVHFNGSRRKRAFVTENCAAVPESLLQSELFGHVRGAFTGADRDRAGLFEQAHGGTLFLDEVGDMSAGMQAQLLRVLEDGDIRRVGSDRMIRVDVRVIAATHRDLQAEAEHGRFRSDLLYRLQVLSVHVPPLRERGDDLALLAGHMVARIAGERGRAVPAIGPRLLQLLGEYSWPGNVRELENVLQRLLLLAGDNPLRLEFVEEDPWLARLLRTESTVARVGSLAVSERERIREALAAASGNRSRAARLLGVSRATIYRKIDEFDL